MLGFLGPLIGKWLAGAWVQLLGIGVAVAAVAAVFLKGRADGRAAERLDIMKRNAEINREQLEAAARRPRNRDELRQRLHDGQF